MTTALAKKWSHLVPVDSPHAEAAMQFLENTHRCAAQTSPGGGFIAPVLLNPEVLRMLAEAFQRSLLHELCSVQMMSQPVGLVEYLPKPPPFEPTAARVDAICLKPNSDAVQAQVRSLRTRWTDRSAAVDRLADVLEPQRTVFDDVFSEWEREVVGDMLNIAPAAPEVDRDYVGGAVAEASRRIWHGSQRGYGNMIVANDKTAVELGLDDRSAVDRLSTVLRCGLTKTETVAVWHHQLYVDTQFPVDKLLIARHGTSSLDAGFVVAPFLIQISDDRSGYVRIRYGRKLVNEDYYQIVKIKKEVK